YWLLGILVFSVALMLLWFGEREYLEQLRQDGMNKLKEITGLTGQGEDSPTDIDTTSISQNPPLPIPTPNPTIAPINSSNEQITLKPKAEINENINYLVAEWYQRLGWWLELLKWAVVLGIFIAFLVYQLYRRNKKQALLQRERNQAPPDYWNPLQITDAPKKLYQTPTFYQTAKDMRVRVEGDVEVLNVDKTIAATLESGGYPSFEYDMTSRPVEYLVLIEEETPKDHQARFFDQLTQELAQQDVYIERYFYQNDPRHCWKIEYQIETNLYELAMQFPSHRLLVMGDGDTFLDGVSEDVLRWTQQFSAWQIRFLVTPKPTKDWGFSEIQLSDIFHILPANIAALEKMDDTLLHPEQYPLKYWLSNDSNNFTSFNEPIEVKDLRQYFDPQTYQLLCACAVYPELHWDFTLHLAKQMSAVEVSTSNEEGNGRKVIASKSLLLPSNLLQLARLPWFREGFIPDAERQVLLADLQSKYEALTRESIVRLLKENPPPTNSYAYNEYAMNLAVNEWELEENAAAKKAHQKALAELMERDKLLQFVRIKYQTSVQKIKNAFAMPELVKENLFKGGLPILGFKNYVLAGLVLLTLAAIAWFVEVPEGEHLTEFEGEYFYLANKRDSARFYQYQAQINLDPVTKQALLDTALAIDTTYAKARYNLALTYYESQKQDGSNTDSLVLEKAIDGFLKTSKIYDIDYESDLENITSNVEKLQFGANDTCFAMISTDDNVIRLWNLDGESLAEFVGHTDKVTSVNFSENYPWVITSSLDGTVRIWDLEGRELYVYSIPYQFYTYACFVPNSDRILVTYTGENGNLEISTLAELEILERLGGGYSFTKKTDIAYLSIGVKNPNFSKNIRDVLYPSKNQVFWKELDSGGSVQTFDFNAPAIAGFFLLDSLLQVTV
ncbi:MAG: hypothetical protein ACPGVB_14710, partial [Chitinophagales bacterium]